jgi:hypothetical protein
MGAGLRTVDDHVGALGTAAELLGLDRQGPIEAGRPHA